MSITNLNRESGLDKMLIMYLTIAGFSKIFLNSAIAFFSPFWSKV